MKTQLKKKHAAKYKRNETIEIVDERKCLYM